MSTINTIIKEKYDKVQTDTTTILQVLDFVIKEEVLSKLPEDGKGTLIKLLEAMNNANKDLKMMVIVTGMITLKETGATDATIFELLSKLKS